jgi:hypothetical protein
MLRFKTIRFDLNQMTINFIKQFYFTSIRWQLIPLCEYKNDFSNILLTSKTLAVCSARRLAFTIKVLHAGEITWQ